MFCCKLEIDKRKKTIKWNNENFNNIFIEKLDNEEELKKFNEEIIKVGMNNDKYIRGKEHLAKQESILAKEEMY